MRGQRRVGLVAVLATTCVSAYFLAAATTRFVAVGLALPSAEASTESPAGTHPADHHARDIAWILRRNVFDAASGCLNCRTTASRSQAFDIGEVAPSCTRPVRVTAAVLSDVPGESFAFLSRDGSPALYREGMSLGADVVCGIGWRSRVGVVVSMCDGVRRCEALVGATAARPTTPAAGTDESIERGVDGDLLVRRAWVDRILADPSELLAVGVVPERRNGSIVGFGLHGVRVGSLLARLGLRDGDVLQAVNGLAVTSPERALEALSRFRTADRIVVSFLRGGSPSTLAVSIRP